MRNEVNQNSETDFQKSKAQKPKPRGPKPAPGGQAGWLPITCRTAYSALPEQSRDKLRSLPSPNRCKDAGARARPNPDSAPGSGPHISAPPRRRLPHPRVFARVGAKLSTPSPIALFLLTECPTEDNLNQDTLSGG